MLSKIISVRLRHSCTEFRQPINRLDSSGLS
jgi:hypothetical protein